MATFTGSAGNDVITPNQVSAGVIAVGAPRPTAGSDSLFGQDGNDTLDGGAGADTILAGAGQDLVLWRLGGGNDVVDGGDDAGTDTFLMTGDDGRADTFVVSPTAGGHFGIQGPSGANLDIVNMNDVVIAPLHGSDSVSVGDTRGTLSNRVFVDLGVGPNDLGDGQTDTVTVGGGEGGINIAYIRELQGVVDLNESPPAAFRPPVFISGFDSFDKLVINGGGGADVIGDFLSGPLPPPNSAPAITLNGMGGDDVLIGGGGDTLNGGSGNDQITIGAGNELADGGIGDDTISFTSFTDASTQVIRGGDGFDTFAALGAFAQLGTTGGARALLTGVGGSTANLDAVERVVITASTNATFDIGDLSTTKVQQVAVFMPNLDVDDGTFRITGGLAANQIDILAGFDAARNESLVRVFGLTAPNTTAALSDIEIHGASAHQTVEVDGGEGADVLHVAANGFGSGLVVRGGKGGDTIQGSVDADGHRLFGDGGNDSISAGSSSFITGGLGNDTMTSGQASTYIFNQGEEGSDRILGFHAASAGSAHDIVALHGAIDHSFAEAVANHRIFESGGSVVVNEGVGLVVTLAGTSLASLGAADFLFG